MVPQRLRTAAARGRGMEGQAATESVFALSFVLTFILALIYLVLLVSTRHVVDYAAFVGARVGMLGSSDFFDPLQRGRDQRAARDAVRTLDWGRPPRSGESAGVFRVDYPTPFAFPLFQAAGNTVIVRGLAPIPRQPDIPEDGDNAER